MLQGFTRICSLLKSDEFSIYCPFTHLHNNENLDSLMPVDRNCLKNILMALYLWFLNFAPQIRGSPWVYNQEPQVKQNFIY